MQSLALGSLLPGSRVDLEPDSMEEEGWQAGKRPLKESSEENEYARKGTVGQ